VELGNQASFQGKPSEKEQQLSYNNMAGFGQPRCALFCMGPNKGHATLVGVHVFRPYRVGLGQKGVRFLLVTATQMSRFSGSWLFVPARVPFSGNVGVAVWIPHTPILCDQWPDRVDPSNRWVINGEKLFLVQDATPQTTCFLLVLF
jgi:hypothetical protein